MKKIHSLLALFFIFYSAANAQSPPAVAVIEKNPFGTMTLLEAQSVSSADFDVYFYRCEWVIDPAVRYITGKVSPYFTIITTTSTVTFDLSKALTVDSVIYHGAKIRFQQFATDALQINFPLALTKGQSDSLSIFYNGVPNNLGFGSFSQSTHDGTPIIWTLSEPYGAKDWWPCKDVLTDKADSIDIIITYPSAYRSSSNGLLAGEQIIGEKKQDYWKHRYPIATYLVAIAVTNYRIDRDSVLLPSGIMPVEMYAYPESAAAFKAATATAKAALQKYSQLLGDYPFRTERYAQTQFGWGGGMEHQTNSFITSPDANLVAHELAHQWFGDQVTNGSWQDIWLNEGFATYMAFVFASAAPEANPVYQLQKWESHITSDPAGSVFVKDTADVGRLFNRRLSYNKGAYVLHMLRWKLGDTTFFRGLRQYLNDPLLRYKTARTADFQRNMEQVSGQHLTGFFNDWVYGEGYPSYKGEWSAASPNAVHFLLSQTTSHPSVAFFEMPVPLQCKNAARDTTIIVNDTQNGEVFTLNPGFIPDTILIDPQLWILSKDNLATKTAVITAIPEMTETGAVQVFPNPAMDRVTVYLPAAVAQKTNIRLFNVLGQQVFSKTIMPGVNGKINIPLPSTPGMYWMVINRKGKKTVTKQVVKR